MGHAVLLRAGRTRDCGSCGSGCGGGVQRCRLQGGDQCAHQHSSALHGDTNTLPALQHAANITQHGRHHGHGATQTHNTCQQVNTQHNTWPGVSTAERLPADFFLVVSLLRSSGPWSWPALPSLWAEPGESVMAGQLGQLGQLGHAGLVTGYPALSSGGARCGVDTGH